MDSTNFAYAGFWKRFLAYIIDGIIINIALSILLIPLFIVLGIGVFSQEFGDMGEFVALRSDPSQSEILIAGAIIMTILIFMLTSFVVNWLYYAIMESSTRQATLGKMAVGLIVTDIGGNRISFGRASGRFFGKILSGAILNIGYIMAAFTQKKQALHDMLADCIVIEN